MEKKNIIIGEAYVFQRHRNAATHKVTVVGFEPTRRASRHTNRTFPGGPMGVRIRHEMERMQVGREEVVPTRTILQPWPKPLVEVFEAMPEE
jgi:hypothetical protein